MDGQGDSLEGSFETLRAKLSVQNFRTTCFINARGETTGKTHRGLLDSIQEIITQAELGRVHKLFMCSAYVQNILQTNSLALRYGKI